MPHREAARHSPAVPRLTNQAGDASEKERRCRVATVRTEEKLVVDERHSGLPFCPLFRVEYL